MLLIGIDEAGYGPLLGPLCHGYAAIRVPDVPLDHAWDLWHALHPSVCRAGGVGIAIDDSKKLHCLAEGLTALETGVRAFLECTRTPPHNLLLDLDTLLPGDDLADLQRDPWFDLAEAVPHMTLGQACTLRNALAKIGAESVAVGARAISARAFNERLATGANKAEVSWRIIARELRRLAGVSRSDESIFAAIDRQGGRKFYAPLISETFECALVHIERESDDVSIYRIDENERSIRIGFYVDGDALHLPIGLASMTAKLAREKCILRFNAYFQRMQPGLKPTAGYHTDAQRFLKDTKVLRAQLDIRDEHLIRTK